MDPLNHPPEMLGTSPGPFAGPSQIDPEFPPSPAGESRARIPPDNNGGLTSAIFLPPINASGFFYAKRIQMDIAHQFQQIRLTLTEDAFIPVLEEVPDQTIAAIEITGISGQ